MITILNCSVEVGIKDQLFPIKLYPRYEYLSDRGFNFNQGNIISINQSKQTISGNENKLQKKAN